MKKHELPDGVRIPNIEALNDAMADGNEGYAIVLPGDKLFARYTITRECGRYRVTNHIDDAVLWLTEQQLLDDRYIKVGAAMKLGAFVTLGAENSLGAEIVGVIPAN